MSNFTPGPWTWRDTKTGDVNHSHDDRFKIECNTNMLGIKGIIARCGYRFNAELIAVAPELYEAAQEMITALNGTYLDDKRRAKEHLEQVLAKVEKGE